MPSKEIEPLAVALHFRGQALAVHLPARVGPGLGLGLPSQESPPCVCLWELQPPRGHRVQEAVWKIAPESWQVECRWSARQRLWLAGVRWAAKSAPSGVQLREGVQCKS